MSFDHDAHYRERLAKEADEHGDIAPPWVKFPTYTRRTIGWRMGCGEDWFMFWNYFIGTLNEARGDRLAYFKRQRPAPRTWADSVLLNLDSRAFAFRPGESSVPIAQEISWLYQEGLVSDDIAYENWRAQLDGPPSLLEGEPVTRENLISLTRILPRELFFYARYNADEGREVTLPKAWRALPPVEEGRARLAMELLRSPWPPGPWTLGCAAGASDDDDDAVSYGRAWRAWVGAVFDDAPSWDAYLERIEPAPEGWAALNIKRRAFLSRVREEEG